MPTRKPTKKPTTRTAAPTKAMPKAKTKAKAKAATPAAPPAKRGAPAPMKHGKRADFGKPIDSFFNKQPAQLRAILVELRAMVEKTAPDATASIKWGMPFFELGGKMFVALGAHKAHVNLILAGPPGAFKDPRGLLTGDGKTGRHLKLADLSELPRSDVQSWLKTARAIARAK